MTRCLIMWRHLERLQIYHIQHLRTLRMFLVIRHISGRPKHPASNPRSADSPLHPLGIGDRAGKDQIVFHRHSSSLSILCKSPDSVRPISSAQTKKETPKRFFSQSIFSIRTTACAAIPEPSPVKPSPSSVVAFTFICSTSIPSAAARFSAIC